VVRKLAFAIAILAAALPAIFFACSSDRRRASRLLLPGLAALKAVLLVATSSLARRCALTAHLSFF